MRTLFKSLAVVVGLALFLLLAAAIVIPLTVDPNDYKETIAKAVQKATGRRLSIDGEIRLSVFPWLGLDLTEASLGNAPGFGNEPFARIRSGRIKVRLLPLIERRVEMDTVYLEGLQVHLVRLADGRTNWQDLASGAGADADSGDGGALGALALGGLHVADAGIVWEDAVNDVRMGIERLALETGPLRPGQPIAVDLSLDVAGTRPALHGRLALATSISFDEAFSVIRLNGNTLSLSGGSSAYGLERGSAELKGSLVLDLSRGLLQLDVPHLELNATASALADTPIQAVLAGPLEIDLNRRALTRLDLDLRASLQKGAGTEAIGATLTGDLQLDGDPQVLRLSDARLTSEGSAAAQGLGRFEAGLTADASLNLDTGDTALTKPSLELQLQGEAAQAGFERARLSLRGERATYSAGTGRFTSAALALEAALKTPATRFLAKGALSKGIRFVSAGSALDTGPVDIDLTASGDDLPGGKIAATLAGQVSAQLDAGDLEVKDLSLKTLGLVLSGRLIGEKLNSAPAYVGALAVAPFNVRKLMQSLGQAPLATSDPRVLGNARLAAAFSSDGKDLHIPKLDLHLDDSRLSGRLDVLHLTNPALAFDLDLDGIDLDRYLSDRSEATPPKEPSARAGARSGAMPAPAGILALPLDGALDIGRLKVAKLRATQVHASVKGKDGVLRLKTLRARLYRGTLNEQASIDMRGKRPLIDTDTELRDIDVGALLSDALGEQRLVGTGNLRARLNTAGASQAEVLAGLNGDLVLDVHDGALLGIDIGRLISQARAVIQGASLPEGRGQQTDFRQLHASARVVNGVVSNEDLKAESSALRIAGRGSFDLPRETMDYRIDATLLDGTRSLTLPVRFTGSLSQPRYSLDPGKLLAEEAKRQLQRQVQKQLENKVQDKLGDQLLRGIFGR